MSAPRITLASLPSLCKKLSKLVEIWRSPAKTILHSFFETRCILTCFLARDQGSLGLRMQDYSLCAGVTICFTAFVMIKAIYRFVNFRRISRKRGNKVYSLLFNRHVKIIWKFARTACWDMNKSRSGYFFTHPLCGTWWGASRFQKFWVPILNRFFSSSPSVLYLSGGTPLEAS